MVIGGQWQDKIASLLETKWFYKLNGKTRAEKAPPLAPNHLENFCFLSFSITHFVIFQLIYYTSKIFIERNLIKLFA